MAGTLMVLGSVVFLLPPQGSVGVWGRGPAMLLVSVQAAAMWWMAERPGPAVAAALVAGAGIHLLYPAVGPGVALVTVCTFAWLRPARVSLWGLAGALVLTAAVPLLGGQRVPALLWACGALLAWSWGALGRARDAGRQAEARRAVLEERARIARELHDVLAHTVSVMVVQAAAADDVFDSSPVKARQAVRELEACGRRALGELRHFLRSVDVDGGQAGVEGGGGEPQPGLGDLDRLAGVMGAAGLDVVVRCEGLDGLRAVSSVELSVYRIVQESLTNVLRHAGAGRAEVLVSAGGGRLLVEVRDDGWGGGGRLVGRGGGRGIAGMRERAALLGGSLEAGPGPGGGFVVRVLLPLKELS